MTSKIPMQYRTLGNASWLSVDILLEHFPYLEPEICLLDDSEIAYIDKKASDLKQYSYWEAMEIAILEHFKNKKKESPKI